MPPLLIAVLAGVCFLVAYHTYGRWLGRKIFRLSAAAVVPSHAFNDGSDFVPTKKSIVFGHHFTSIAGTGPIVGPAIAIMYGWVPALLWVILGSIFIGAVHDFGSLVVSLRSGGRSVGDIAGDVLNRRVKLLFLCVLFVCLLIVIAIFGLVIAAVFKQFPASIFPCMVQAPIALVIGLWLHRKGRSLTIPSILALAVMYATVFFGDVGFLHTFNTTLAAWPNWVWIALLLAYGFVASVLPVWTLLQPRDYINSLQLLSALGLIVVGLVVATFIGGAPPVEGAGRVPLEMVAPAWNLSPAGAPPIWPFLFITIACGAVSGFHCLVSSGTSSKQLAAEPEARFVGFGAMLTEGFLAVLVILACGAGLGLGLSVSMFDSSIPVQAPGDMHLASDRTGAAATGATAFQTQYRSWQSADGLGAKVGAFVTGAGNFLAAIGLPVRWASALVAVLVASFALTTLDTTVRLQRYVCEELWGSIRRREEAAPPAEAKRLKLGPIVFSAVAVVTGAMLAMVPGNGDWSTWTPATAGTGGMLLWPLFGASNQLLAGLAFCVILFYLRRRRIMTWFLVPPMLFMLVMPAWAMMSQLPDWWTGGRYVLVVFGGLCLALETWMVVEAALLYPRVRGIEEGSESRGFEVVSR